MSNALKAYAAELAKLIAVELAEIRPQRRVLGLAEAAEYLGVSDETLRRLAMNGRIQCVRIDRHRRFDIRDLDRFIDTHKE